MWLLVQIHGLFSRKRMKRQFKSIISFVILILLVSSFSSCGEEKELRVFIQDKAAVITSEGCVAMIGTGNGIVENISTTHIDYLIIHDYSSDTLSGFARLSAEYDIEYIYMPGYDGSGEEYNKFLEQCYVEDAMLVRVDGSMSFALGDGSISVSSGMSSFYNDPTDNSLMTRIVLGDKRMVFCGSARGERLAEYLRTDNEKCTHLNLCSSQLGYEESIVQTLLPEMIIFTDCDPFVAGYDVYDRADGAIIYKE